MYATEVTSLPQTIAKGVIELTRSTSSVCRSLSPLMAPAATAGAKRQTSASCTTARTVNTLRPIWAKPSWLLAAPIWTANARYAKSPSRPR